MEAVTPTKTLDERIKSRFTPGAVYHHWHGRMDTIYERRLRKMSRAIRARPDWMDTLNDADTRAGWATEARVLNVTDLEFRYVLDELAYYSSLHLPDSSIRLSAADGVWFSDALIDAETTKGLKDYAVILENVPDSQKDWHPAARTRILSLIDPSLYPLIYGRSWLRREPSTSTSVTRTLDTLEELPGSLEGWRQAKWAPDALDSECYLPVIDRNQVSYVSDRFSWLPSEFRVDDNGAVMIESYINNLHPIKHAALYLIIASVFSKCLPLLEQVLTGLVHPRKPGVEFNLYDCYEYSRPEPERGRRPYYDYLAELECWHEDAAYKVPQPKPFVVPARPINPYSLHGRRLQAIVRMSNIELLSKKYVYGGKGWSVAGLDNEHIIATGIFFYEVVNIAQCSLEFREPLNAHHAMSSENEFHAIGIAYGIDADLSGRTARFSQELGNVDIKDGLCIVFPNIYQYKMPRIRQDIASTPGHCKMLMFYFVDPTTRIPSTEIVPPQQRDCYKH
ncbi:hypothetical protein H4S07_002336 [Coemansia furcata]|uniref:Uncharacterized protein n=1 Tax=Coemansia furcata TaxID=417177 RepID=A0ACC1LJW6_9FUNG|nr:hypothetical protein H4S07_002336 [Coemansia furcata]